MSKDTTASALRIPIGVWTEFPAGTKWANEGMSRLLGFLVEGAALGQKYVLRIVLGDGVRAAAEEDLANVSAKEGVDYTLHSPNDSRVAHDDYKALSRFANSNVTVRGWISMFPQFRHAVLLDKPVATVFPDGIPLIFPTPDPGAWSKNGYLTNWTKMVGKVLNEVDRVITFSDHVARGQVHDIFGISLDKVHVVNHAPPNLAHLAPYTSGGQRTAASLKAAGDLLRSHARSRKWSYLADYPFEEVNYLAVSTQDRVTKNIRAVADAVRFLVRTERQNIRLFMTTPIHFGATWTPLPHFLEEEMLTLDVFSMPDLPRHIHAAFYHCAGLAIHPSIFEGGRGVFPFYEACSVGTPCLMADGPHVQEFVAHEPTMLPFVFDANDLEQLSAQIRWLINDRGYALSTQLEVFNRLSQRTWADVTSGYCEAAMAGSSAARANLAHTDGMGGT